MAFRCSGVRVNSAFNRLIKLSIIMFEQTFTHSFIPFCVHNSSHDQLLATILETSMVLSGVFVQVYPYTMVASYTIGNIQLQSCHNSLVKAVQ